MPVHGKTWESLAKVERSQYQLRVDGVLASRFSLIEQLPGLRSVRKTLDSHTASTVPLLFTGPSGVGKNQLVKYMYWLSSCEGPLVSVNCASLSPQFLESELFGHEKGAFTGAHSRKVGKLMLAHGGIIFLDEVQSIPKDSQPKLLNVLDEGVVTPLGSNDFVAVRFRLISATSSDLLSMVDANQFDRALYWRMRGRTVDVTPLCDRPLDISLYIEHFLSEWSSSTGTQPLVIEDTARQMLIEYPWPGNIRELQWFLLSACCECTESVLGEAYVLDHLDHDFGTDYSPSSILELVERRTITSALAVSNSDRVAAKKLHIGPRLLQNKKTRLGIRSIDIRKVDPLPKTVTVP